MIASSRQICGVGLLAASSCLFLAAQSNFHSAPIEVIRGKPFAMVMVNGKGPFRFVIDTGTGAEAFVTEELVHQLELPETGQVRLRDPSGQGGQRAPLVQMESLEVAGLRFAGVKAIEHPLSSEDGACLGLLGFVLFRNYLLTLDFPGRRMTLAHGALEPDGGRSVLPFRMPDGVPIVPLRIGAMSFEAQVDSGGEGLSLPEQLVAQLRFSEAPVAFSNGESLSTRFQIKAAKLASDVHLGSYTFTRPFVEINPAFPLANFGSCPMQSFALTFDQRNGLIRFDARQKSIRLAVTPTPLRLQSMPPPKPADVSLVPVG